MRRLILCAAALGALGSMHYEPCTDAQVLQGCESREECNPSADVENTQQMVLNIVLACAALLLTGWGAGSRAGLLEQPLEDGAAVVNLSGLEGVPRPRATHVAQACERLQVALLDGQLAQTLLVPWPLAVLAGH